MKNVAIILVVLFFTVTSNSQNVCDLTDKTEFLHVNNVRASIGNRGENFSNGEYASFQIPYLSHNSPNALYETGIWLGAIDQNEQAFNNIVFYKYKSDCGYLPGPFTNSSTEQNCVIAENWNKIFKVTGEEIKAHKKDYIDQNIDNFIVSIYGWPGKGNQFFKQVNGFELFEDTHAGFEETPGHINGIYEPNFGEYPKVEGLSSTSIPGAILWSVYSGGVYNTQSMIPIKGLKIQIEQTSWAMDCSDEILSTTLFTRYHITNKNDSPYHDFRFGLFTDPDLGCPLDDAFGAFPNLNSYYAYNSLNIDKSDCKVNVIGYGDNPPVEVVTFLGENGLDGFIVNDFNFTKLKQENYINILNNKHADGKPITYGGNGYNPNSTDTVFYMFPDKPSDANGWSMYRQGYPYADMHCIGLSRLKNRPGFIFEPDNSITYDIAFSFYKKEGYSNIENVIYAELKIPELIEKYNAGLPDCSSPLCDCSCLWPGDTDKNGFVDYKDYINILKSFGKTGPTRSNPVAWVGVDAQNWSPVVGSGLNPKYADVNGDGLINKDDLDIIDDFLGQKNFCFAPEPTFCEEGDELKWEYQMVYPTLTENRLVNTTIILKNENNFAGIYYEVEYDPEIFTFTNKKNELKSVDESSFNIFIDKNSDFEAYKKHLFHFNDKMQNVKLAEESNNKLAKLTFLPMNIPDSFPSKFIEIKICNATVFYEDGTEKKLPSQTLHLQMPDYVVITGVEDADEKNTKDQEITVFPNPGSGVFQLNTHSKNLPLKVDIFDINGKYYNTRTLNFTNEIINLSSFQNGMYILKMKNDKFTEFEKVLLLK